MLNTIVIELVKLVQLIVGLMYLACFALIGFAIADALGFVGPLPREEPSKRWLERQRPKTELEKAAKRSVRRTRIIYAVSILVAFASGFLLGMGVCGLVNAI